MLESNWIILPKTPKNGEDPPESSTFSPVFVSSNVNAGYCCLLFPEQFILTAKEEKGCKMAVNMDYGRVNLAQCQRRQGKKTFTGGLRHLSRAFVSDSVNSQRTGGANLIRPLSDSHVTDH